MSSSSATAAIDADHDSRKTPLLQNPTSRTAQEEEIVPILPWSHPPEDASTSTSAVSDQGRRSRLVSLDVFRGLTVAIMILVDDAGGAFPSINHSPWFGVTIADLVMPFFLFIVGVSISLVFKKVPRNLNATWKVILRTIKLFLLGVLLQGGYFHGRHSLTYGVDLEKIRWLGVLQRISIGYLLASIAEIWLINNVVVDSILTFLRKYFVQWIAAVLLCTIYVCLLYGLYVPSWKYEVPGLNSTLLLSNTQIVQCGVRGSLGPPCNAVGLVDRFLLGEQHLYQHPVYRRTKECSVNSPDYGPLPPNSPGWCLAPFDPEGILSSLMAAVTCFVGLHFGHIMSHFKDPIQRMLLWSLSSFPLLISGFLLQLLGMTFSKPLYTLSYMCITAGLSGLVFIAIFYLVDVQSIRRPTVLLQWMGMNALIIYALAACDIFAAFLQGFYLRSPENNLVDGTEMFLQALCHSKKWGTLVFVMVEILFWGLVAGFLHWKGIYVKL
ncbi:hypothetical protein Ancab_021810 [Ancistrocladus abbreviatus]